MTLNISNGDLLGIQAVLDVRKEGNFQRLAERLRDFLTVLSREEREFLADYIEGKVKLKNGKRKDKMLRDRAAFVYDTYYWLTKVEGLKGEAANAKCREIYGIGRSSVTNYRKVFKGARYPVDTMARTIEAWRRGEMPHLSHEELNRYFLMPKTILDSE